MSFVRFFFFSSLFVFALKTNAQLFMHPYLKDMAQHIGILDQIHKDSIDCTYFINYNNRFIKIKHNTTGRVSHIGLNLFNQTYETLYPSPIYDFIEYQALKHYSSLKNDYHLTDNVHFLKGSWNDLYTIDDNWQVETGLINNNIYNIKWSKGNKITIELTIPINYEILSNQSRKELLADFLTELREEIDYKKKTIVYNQSPASYYLMPEITLSTPVDSIGNAIYDKWHPVESFHNLLLIPSIVAPSAMVKIFFYTDGNNKNTIEIPLFYWNAICMSHGCQPYFGYENNNNGIAKGVQIMNNPAMGYDHVVYIECKEDDIGNSKIQLKGTAFLFIPTTNVKELFAKPLNSSKKNIKQREGL